MLILQISYQNTEFYTATEAGMASNVIIVCDKVYMAENPRSSIYHLTPGILYIYVDNKAVQLFCLHHLGCSKVTHSETFKE